MRKHIAVGFQRKWNEYITRERSKKMRHQHGSDINGLRFTRKSTRIIRVRVEKHKIMGERWYQKMRQMKSVQRANKLHVQRIFIGRVKMKRWVRITRGNFFIISFLTIIPRRRIFVLAVNHLLTSFINFGAVTQFHVLLHEYTYITSTYHLFSVTVWVMKIIGRVVEGGKKPTTKYYFSKV